ncbi:FIZZY-related 2-like protein [Tanacetum coccineum]
MAEGQEVEIKSILQRDPRAQEDFVSKLNGHKSEVCGLKWSYDNRELASSGNDNRLFVWNQHSTQPVLKYCEHTATVKAIAWSPHGFDCVIVCRLEKQLEETDLTSLNIVVAEDLGQKHIHDFNETVMFLMTDKDDDPGEATTDRGSESDDRLDEINLDLS